MTLREFDPENPSLLDADRSPYRPQRTPTAIWIFVALLVVLFAATFFV